MHQAEVMLADGRLVITGAKLVRVPSSKAEA